MCVYISFKYSEYLKNSIPNLTQVDLTWSTVLAIETYKQVPNQP